MSGHSKWHKIKHKKAANDAKKGKVFTKLGKAITLAAAESGGDIDINFSLRLAVEKARSANMPNDNIEKAIKKGTGDEGGSMIERMSYEAYGPDSSALIIDCATDNKNRTISEVKKIIENNGGKFAQAGSVSWQFEEKGMIIVKPAILKKAEKFGAEDTYEPIDKDELMMNLIEIDGIIDILEQEFDGDLVIEISTNKIDFSQIDKAIREKKYNILSSELIKDAKEKLELDSSVFEKVQKLIEELDENDDVDEVWTNVLGL